MVTQEQLIKGIITYTDKEVMPHLPTVGRWGVGSVIILAQGRISQIADSMLSNTFAKTLGVVDDNNCIDIDTIHDALKMSAEKYGNVQIELPVIGTMTFTVNDIDKLAKYVKGGMQ